MIQRGLSMTEQAAKQRVIVYIDGYNLYHGMQEAFGNKYKWLDLQSFSGSFLRPGMELVAVKYFTAITKKEGSVRRQEVYLKALESYCDKLEIFYGVFLAKDRRCHNCGTEYVVYEEKETDVNIACEILNDTHLDNYDCCYVVSGDGDLVPPLKIVREYHPGKRVIVACPPRRRSEGLCMAADGWFAIGKRKFKDNQLPETVASIRGGRMFRPPEWK